MKLLQKPKPSRDTMLELFRAYTMAEPLTPSGYLHVYMSEKLHTRFYGLMNKRDKTKIYAFNLPDAPNKVVAHLRKHVGLLEVGTRIIAPSEANPGDVSVQLVTQFEFDNGFVPAHLRDERKSVGDASEFVEWITARNGEFQTHQIHHAFAIEMATTAAQMEFRLRWE